MAPHHCTFALSAEAGYPRAMLASPLTDALEAIAPLRYAESWDNVGLLVGSPDHLITKVMLCIDYTDAVAKEADAKHADFVVAYHPIIFEGIKRIAGDTLIYDAIKKGRGIYSPHTALDIAEGGTNDVLADAVGMTARHPLRKLGKRNEAEENMGLGRVGPVNARTRAEVVAQVKTNLKLTTVLVAGPEDGPVSMVAVSAGSAGDMIKDAQRAGVDLYVTGELRHHDALWAAARGMTVVCLRHSTSERAVLVRLAQLLRERLRGLDVVLSESDADPFRFV
ncbi:Nif3-like dinuclear metal center hexameric protein [soil metagenome]